MKNTDLDHDKHASVSNALRRDAARLTEPPFDAALHHATTRRIRALSSKDSPQRVWRWAIACTAVLLLGLITTLKRVEPSPSPAAHQAVQTEETAYRAPQSSLWAYQKVAAQGEEAFIAMLDRDAQTFLPPTSSIFTVPLN